MKKHSKQDRPKVSALNLPQPAAVKLSAYGWRTRWVKVGSYADASRTFRRWIETNTLAVSVVTGGYVRDAGGRIVATVSYNGRVWQGEGFEGPEVQI